MRIRIRLVELSDVHEADCIIVAVAHDEFRKLGLDDLKMLYRISEDEEKVLLDVKGLYKVSDLNESGMRYWRL